MQHQWHFGAPSDFGEEVEVEFGFGDVDTVRVADRYRKCVDTGLPHGLAGRRVGEVRVLDLGAVFRRSADGADLGLDADPGRSGDPDHVTGELQVLLQWEGGTVEHDAGVAVANAFHDLVEGRAMVQVEAGDDVAAADHRGDPTMFWFPA